MDILKVIGAGVVVYLGFKLYQTKQNVTSSNSSNSSNSGKNNFLPKTVPYVVVDGETGKQEEEIVEEIRNDTDDEDLFNRNTGNKTFR